MIIEQKNKEWIEKVLSDIPFVNWDRFLDLKWARNRNITVFGWIEREDSYKDFVVLEFDLVRSEVFFVSTSSEKYSKKISEILGSSHTICQRVEDNFNVNNSIKLQEVSGNSSHN